MPRIYFSLMVVTVKKSKKENNIKICFVGSSGGHLMHLYMLKSFWHDKERFWVTFDKEDAKSLLRNDRLYFVYYPSNRSIKALFINTYRAVSILRKEKPDLIISAGAAPAVPFFFIGKLMRKKLIFIETFDRFDKMSMSGKLCYKMADVFIVQWEEMKKICPKAIYIGSLF